MRISIAFSGPAGSGVNTAGILLGTLLSKKGYTILGNKQYSSVIKGGNNIFVLYISDKEPYISNKIDLFISYDDFGLNKNKSIYKINKIFDIKSNKDIYINTYSFGVACSLLNLSIDESIEFSTTFFKKELDKNLLSLQTGYHYLDHKEIDLSENIGPSKSFYFGNEVIGKGAIASGLQFYSAYPMTPATSIINVITKDPNVIFYQGEDEIAVSMAMLGAKFAGHRAMCATSGGGFALMSESISFSGIAEIGGVYVLSQRAGPSTGTPTFSEQGDIEYGLIPTFGGLKPIVLYPGSFEQTYNMIGKALNWSDIYQHPVVFLVDKEFSESYLSVENSNYIAEKINKGKIVENPEENFARYRIMDDGISPYTIPGIQNGEFITSSYEHDEYGVSIDDPQTKVAFTDKRYKKLETFSKNEFNDNYFGYEVINNSANKFFITVGFNYYGLQGYISNNPEWGIITIQNLYPLDFRLKDFLLNKADSIEKLVFVEQNYSGQLQSYITNSFNLNTKIFENKIKSIRKYDLYPIFEETLGEKI